MVKIRKFKRTDINRLVEIFRQEYKKKPYNEKWKKESAKSYIGGKSRYFFVAIEGKAIVGFIQGNLYPWHDGLRGHINEIVVDSKYQRKGIGKALIKFIIKQFKKKKANTIALSAKRKANAFKFYKKLNFKDEGEGYISLKRKI
ncbi:MAG TPA: GNAT family N-acetyltransferase [Candidatus Nanoarchaeia archaeon]|nr:GNAT family N-acetyltransferase [Candidatus Nanoarchaeia archaeon]